MYGDPGVSDSGGFDFGNYDDWWNQTVGEYQPESWETEDRRGPEQQPVSGGGQPPTYQGGGPIIGPRGGGVPMGPTGSLPPGGGYLPPGSSAQGWGWGGGPGSTTNPNAPVNDPWDPLDTNGAPGGQPWDPIIDPWRPLTPDEPGYIPGEKNAQGGVEPTKPATPTQQNPVGPVIPTTPVRPTGEGGPPSSSSSSAYSYAKPVHTFDPAQAKEFAPSLAREDVQGLKFTDLLAREQNGGLPFNEMIAREQAPDQQYGKQQALEAANEANALLAQGLKRRHADIAGSLGARGMGEGGASARLGDLATSETLGQQASNIRQAYENAARYGDERSLDIFGKQIGQRGQDVSQQGQLNNAILELLGQGVTQRGQDTALASQINQGGLDVNAQRIAQRGQDVDQQRTVAQIIQSLLGQDQRESWQNSSSSGGGSYGGGGGGNNNYMYNNLLYDMFLR